MVDVKSLLKKFSFQWSWTVFIFPLCVGLFGIKYYGLLLSLCYCIVFLGSLFLHELGRSLVFVARNKSVSVFFSGLGARWKKGGQLFSVLERLGACFCGWAVSLVVFLVAFLFSCITDSFSKILFELFRLIAEVNLLILIINLFPAKPMDMGYLVDTLCYACLQDLGLKLAFCISFLSYFVLIFFLFFIGKGVLGAVFLINLFDDFRFSIFSKKKELYY
ncbi:hypothetical protein [Chlamydiifrater phoenicopteri]|uniref:hypothetical protein n=1 Tax=Chlamydiifrater phoenicopteri TaxID=2681469 RepID=UPI001BD07B56|nr:hypothetical protein [Chlamydiifrater phoenicopteri]